MIDEKMAAIGELAAEAGWLPAISTLCGMICGLAAAMEEAHARGEVPGETIEQMRFANQAMRNVFRLCVGKDAPTYEEIMLEASAGETRQ